MFIRFDRLREREGYISSNFVTVG